MDKIIDSLSTRELAYATWSLIAFTVCMFNKKIRESFANMIKALFAWKISVTLLAFFIHSALYVYILFNLGLWDISLLKDTLIWALSFGFISLMNAIKVNESKYFKTVLFSTINWIIALEFILNFFTFNLPIELIFVPIIVFSVMIKTYTSNKTEYKPVENLFKYILIIFGIAIFVFSLYKTIYHLNQVFTLDNLKSFLLPVYLSLTFLPFMYIFTLFCRYEVLWVRLNFLINDKQKRLRIKKQILLVANLNIDKLVSISKNISKPINVNNDFSNEMIKSISIGKYRGSDEDYYK